MKAASVLGFVIVLLVGVFPGAASAGTLVGTIKAQSPTKPESGAGAGGAYQSRRYKFAERIDYEQLRDFVVSVDQDLPAAPKAEARVVQKDVAFEPHVLPISVGTTVRWPNDDDIYHNVFSMSDGKQFNLGYYTKERVPAVLFDHVGRVDVFCGIHANMHCIVLVLPNSYFAKTDAKGRYSIADLPAGTYRLKAWHERLPPQVKEVAVPERGEVNVDFLLGLSGLPPP